MESSQQLQSQKEPQYIIMLPSQHVPQQLISQIADVKDFSIKFINGYRNILQVSGQSKLEWALTQNQDYCGQAFCYLLKPIINKQELLKKQVGTHHAINFLSQEIFVVQSVPGFTPNNLTITQQELNKLIEQVAESKQSHKLAINLVKNAFQSYEAYNKAVGQVIQKLQKKIESQMQEKIPTVGQALSLEENVKKLHGEMIGKLPKCNKETGQWDEGETIDIKLSLE